MDNITVFNPKSELTRLNTSKSFYAELVKLLQVKRVTDKDLVRIGNIGDGGYIMVNNPVGNIAYSFGIGNNVSWDKGMAMSSYEVFMYDHTIEHLPEDNKRFHFFKEGIADKEFRKQNLHTLNYYIKKNCHQNETDMILKMDVEGAEWDALSTISYKTLKMFDQIVIELHDLIEFKSEAFCYKILSCLNYLVHDHTVVHLHPNNCDSWISVDNEMLFPNTLEVTLVKTLNYNLSNEDIICLPIYLDESNDPRRDDLVLGFWNERFQGEVSY